MNKIVMVLCLAMSTVVLKASEEHQELRATHETIDKATGGRFGDMELENRVKMIILCSIIQKKTWFCIKIHKK